MKAPPAAAVPWHATAIALLVAGLAWFVSPQVLSVLHLGDFELVGRLGCVILALTAAEHAAQTVLRRVVSG